MLMINDLEGSSMVEQGSFFLVWHEHLRGKHAFPSAFYSFSAEILKPFTIPLSAAFAPFHFILLTRECCWFRNVNGVRNGEDVVFSGKSICVFFPGAFFFPLLRPVLSV